MKTTARKILSMKPAEVRAQGGMTYEEAYEIIFRTNLRQRLQTLVAEYGNTGPWCWEMNIYGWDNAADLLEAL